MKTRRFEQQKRRKRKHRVEIGEVLNNVRKRKDKTQSKENGRGIRVKNKYYSSQSPRKQSQFREEKKNLFVSCRP